MGILVKTHPARKNWRIEGTSRPAEDPSGNFRKGVQANEG